MVGQLSSQVIAVPHVIHHDQNDIGFALGGGGRRPCQGKRRHNRQSQHDCYFTFFIQFRIGSVTVLSAVSGENTTDMWLCPLT